MKHKLQLFLILIIAVIFVSCATSPPIKMDQIQTIHRGIHYEKVTFLIKRKPTSSYTIQHKNVSYFIAIYPMQTGTKTETMVFYSRYAGAIPYQVTIPVSEDYVFVFDDDGLIFWGFLDECHKADDELVQQLAPLISQQYEKEKPKQKASTNKEE